MKGRAELRLGITEISPSVSCRTFSARAVVGEWVPIRATVFGEGHDLVGATVVLTGPRGVTKRPAKRVVRMEPNGVEPDEWRCLVSPDAEGLWSFVIEGWQDPWATWLHAIHAKLDAGQDAAELANDLETGARILDRAAGLVSDSPEQPCARPPASCGTRSRNSAFGSAPPSVTRSTHSCGPTPSGTL